MICIRNDDPDVADCPAVFFRFVYLHKTNKYPNGKQLSWAINQSRGFDVREDGYEGDDYDNVKEDGDAEDGGDYG